jgi:uncharacterized protein YbgA (DUF1722 family)
MSDVAFPTPRLILVGRGADDGAAPKRLIARCDLLRLEASEIPGVLLERGEVDGLLVPPGGGVGFGRDSGCAVAAPRDLEDGAAAHRFLSLLFGLARLRAVRSSGSTRDLIAFHARYKYLLLAYSEAGMRQLGRVTATVADRAWEATIADYRNGFVEAFHGPATAGSWSNALDHAFGHLSEHLPDADRRVFLETLAEVRAARIGPGAALDLLRHWAARYDVPYIAGQALLHPFPELLLPVDQA